MIDKESKIALVLRSREEIDFFSGLLSEMGYENLQSFSDPWKAFDSASQTPFDMIIVRQEHPDMSGVVFIQKLRKEAKGAEEALMFVCDKVDDKILNILQEHDIGCVLVKPVTIERLIQKFEFLRKSVNSASSFEKNYRNAKQALRELALNRAGQLVMDLLSEQADSEKANILLGDIELKREHISAARTCYKKVLEKNPKSAIAAHKLAHTYILEKDFETATRLTNELTKLNPYNISLLLDAGLANCETGNLDKAMEHARAVDSLDKGNKQSSEIKASVHAEKDDYSNSIDALKATHSEKELIGFFNNVGVKFAKKANPKKALALYEDCLKKFPSSEFIYILHYNMGLSYARMKNTEKARTCLETAIQKNPKFDKAKQALKNLDTEKKG